MANVQPGIAYTPTLLITDSAGTPVTASVTGTMTLTGPTGTVLGSGTLAHQGSGQWGTPFAGSLLTASGTYTYTVPSLVTPSGTRVNQGGVFDVGISNLPLLEDVYVQVRRALRDGFTGTSTDSGTTTTLVDARRYKRGNAADWVASEIFLLNPPNSADDNPLYVTAFDPTTGIFTFANNAITSTVAGLRFVLGNLAGLGWTHDQVMDALQLAIRRTGGAPNMVDESSLTYSSTLNEYAAPVAFDRVVKVSYQYPGAYQGQWLPIAERYWEWQDGRQLVVFTHATGTRYYRYGNRSTTPAGFSIPNGSKLRLEGYGTTSVPLNFQSPVDVDPARIRDTALVDLLMQRPEAAHRQRAAMIAGQMGRPTVRLP